MQAWHLQIIFFSSLFLALILTPLCGKIATKLDIVDRPGHRKTHHKPVPYLGGVALFLSTTLVMAGVYLFRESGIGLFDRPGVIKGLFILFGTLGIMGVGFLDDMKNLRARYKFLGQFLVVGLFVTFGFKFEILHLPGLPPVYLSYFAVPLTMFWMLSIVNAFNLIDGLDGLAASVAGGSFLMLGACASALDNPSGMAIAFCGLGALIGFLFYNWKPARIYLGDAGSSGIGMFLASSIVALGQTYGVSCYQPAKIHSLGQPFNYQVVVATLLVLYPAMEITISVARRLAHGRPISRADRGHIHHRLLKAGIGVRAIAVTAAVVNIIPGIAVYQIMTDHKGKAAVILLAFTLIVGIGLTMLGFFDFLKPKVVSKLRPHFQIAHYFIEMQRAKMPLANTRDEVLALVHQTAREFGVQEYRMLLLPGKDKKGGFDYASKSHDDKQPVLLGFMLPSQKHVEKYRDQVKLPDGKGGAHWVFESHEGEEDLDMEYRVIFSEFMRESLEALVRLGEKKDTVETQQVSVASLKAMSGHALRKRQKSRNFQ